MIRAKTESSADVIGWIESEAAGLWPAMLGSLSFRRSRCGRANCPACLSGALRLADWYTPPSRDVMEACGLDLGSSGPAIIQDSGRVLGAGKAGILYVLHKDAMGKTDAPFDLTTAGQWRGAPDCKIGQCFRFAENQHGQPNTKQACSMQ